jgi:hypothetical protein
LKLSSTHWIWIAWFMTCLPAEIVAADSVTLQEVLTITVVTPPSRIRFHEEKHNSLLAEPLVLSGVLEYNGLGQLRKVVQAPFAESFTVDGDRIIVERSGETQVLNLDRSRSIQVFVRAFQAILAGDSDKIENDFEVALTGTAEAWSAVLVPRLQRFRKRVPQLQLVGDAEAVNRITIELDGGERHVMTFIHQSDKL